MRAAVLAFCTPDQSIAPAVREYRGVEVDAVDAEAVQLLEGGELAGDALDDVG
ncbi:hypothetical protein [uncultured Friedmanniella sp.]|uniref:hypothetical protein n=1 Tax=uncultured Friedmanniella sp. TaxID=335381 RepID=UPI0035CC400C